MQVTNKTIRIAFSAGILLLAWEGFALAVQKPAIVPDLPELFATLYSLISSLDFYYSIAATISRGMLGLLISATLAISCALLFARNKTIYELFKPLLTLMRSVPVISFILFALIFLQPEFIPLIIAFLTMFPLLSENITKGLLHMKPELTTMGHLFHLSSFNYYSQIVYPQLKPFLFSGLASAMGFGWRAIIMGEVLSQCTLGIGSEMKRAQTFIEVPELLAWTLVAVAISYLFDKGIDWLSRKIVPIRFGHHTIPVPHTAPDIEIKNVTFGYNKQEVLKNFSQRFEKERIYGISAPSGRGKTTLLNLISGQLTPISGEIKKQHATRFACVFQEPYLINHLSAIQNIALPLANYYTKEKALESAACYCTMMEIGDIIDQPVSALSYGQQQRIAIARALAFPADVLLMDEPFKGLDEPLTNRIILEIRKLHERTKQTIIFVSHQPETLTMLADETIKI